jgi:hypothetical protein
MNDNEFWIKTWKNTLIAFCIITVSGMVSCQSSKYQLRKMTEATGSGIESSCAIEMISDGGINQAGAALICAQYQKNK